MSSLIIMSQQIKPKDFIMLNRVVRILCYARDKRPSNLFRSAITSRVIAKFFTGMQSEADLLGFFYGALPWPKRRFRQTKESKEIFRWEDDGGA